MRKIIIFLVFFFSHAQSQEIKVASFLPQPPWTGYIYSLNLNTCEASNLVTSLSFTDIALASDGQLYGTENSWFRINQANGSTTSLPPSPHPNVSANNIVALDNNTLLFIGSALPGFHLYGYHISDGTVTDFGNVGHPVGGDLAWYDNALYFTKNRITWEGPTGDVRVDNTDLIRIVLNADNTVQNVVQINDNTNPLPGRMFGLASVPVPNSNNILVGACDNKIYKICPFDGSYELICETNNGKIAGLASARPPVQNPQPISCNNLSLSDLENNFSMYPNPVSKDGMLYLKMPNGTSPFNVRIMDMQGITLCETILQANSSEIDLKNLNVSSGIYVIEISLDNKTKVHKLIIE